MSKCSKCNNYEVDEENDNRGWCSKEHRWVEWNSNPDYEECGE